MAAGLTLDAVIDRIEQETGRRYTRGAISAVENGHRGASNELIEALEIAYGLPHGAIDTLYRPRRVAELKGGTQLLRQEHLGATTSVTSTHERAEVHA
ncbi:hypothetical protein ACFWWS_39865 [Streptomyces sp. NPDC059083]|uniref:hypothetical protein n=1 Tax=Streptomyces sp. NPDC059083 TaxID=3346721 RepID=UPI00369ABFCD